MDQFLGLCSDTPLRGLPVPAAAAPLVQRFRAARAIRACVGDLVMPYREAPSYRLGIEGELLSDEEIAAGLHVALDAIGPLVDEAIGQVGWAPICGTLPAAFEPGALGVAA
jgi:hypothetical protein